MTRDLDVFWYFAKRREFYNKNLKIVAFDLSIGSTETKYILKTRY